MSSTAARCGGSDRGASASVAAVTLAVLANQSSLGWRRDQVAAADLARQAQQVQAVASDSHSEARRLASAIETLNGDRDRLYSRVTVLEQGLDSVAGAIARQTAAPAWPQQAPAFSPAAEPPMAANPPPAVSPVATAAARHRGEIATGGRGAGSGNGRLGGSGRIK